MEIVQITCATPGCGYSPFPMEEGYYQRAKRTHEHFLCPAGHSNAFLAATKEERIIKEQGKSILALRQRVRRLELALVEAHSDCPWIECEFIGATPGGLRTHLRAAHGMPTLAMAAEAS